jgi:uncharacterized membrane protein YkoI
MQVLASCLMFAYTLGAATNILAQSAQDIQTQLDPSRRGASTPAAPNASRLELTERQAVSRARSQYSGNVLRISLVGSGGNKRYQIRMEKDGKVFTLFVHARTGKITRGG